MQVAYFATRTAAVFAILYAQFYLLTTRGILPGVPTALMHQTGLQVLAILVAPAGFRVVAAALAAWVSIAIAIIIAFAWVTVVVPIMLIIGAVQHGEPQMLFQLIGLTAYLVIPAGLIAAAFVIDQMRPSRLR